MDCKILHHPTVYGLGRPEQRAQYTELENHTPVFGCYAKLLCERPKVGLHMIYLMDKLHHYCYLAFSAMEYTAIPACAFGLPAYSWDSLAQLG